MTDRAMITDPHVYFTKGCGRCDKFETPDCVTRHWSDGLTQLRRICLAAGLTEHAKWGHPCYMHAGRNIVLIGALRDSYRLGFFHPALMTDPEGILVKQGPNTQDAGTVKFTTDDQVLGMEATLSSYLKEAMGYAEQGLVPEKSERTLSLPDELTAAMDDDPYFAEAFHALTPGRQRGWALHYNGAKKAETQVSRVAKSRDKVMAGKGWNER